MSGLTSWNSSVPVRTLEINSGIKSLTVYENNELPHSRIFHKYTPRGYSKVVINSYKLRDSYINNHGYNHLPWRFPVK